MLSFSSCSHKFYPLHSRICEENVSVNLDMVVLSIKLQKFCTLLVTFLCFIVVVVREMFYCTAVFQR